MGRMFHLAPPIGVAAIAIECASLAQAQVDEAVQQAIDNQTNNAKGTMMAWSRTVRRASLATICVLAAIGPAAAQDPTVVLGASPGQDAIALPADGVAKAIAALPALVRETMERSGVPGVAVAVVHGGETVYAEGFGVREIGKPEPITPETVFQLASVSKPMSATIAAIEISRGVAAWDDPASKYLPDLALSDPWVTAHATIGDFFAHRTGLPAAAGDDLEDLGYSRDEVIARLVEQPLDSFRSSYHYANFGTTIAAEAIAAAAGQSWEDLADAVLFEPLGMNSASYRFADYMARENRAIPHTWQDGRFQALYQRQPDPQAPAGGASSDAVDLAEWVKLLLAGGVRNGTPLIAPDVLVDMLRPHGFAGPAGAIDARSTFYSYGFGVRTSAGGRMSYGHSGAFTLGAGTTIEIMPSADVGIIILTNGSPLGLAEAIYTSFMETVQFGAPTRDWYPAYNARLAPMMAPLGDLSGQAAPAEPAAARPLSAYVGEYESAYFGIAAVREKDGGLVLTLGPRGDTFPLAHWTGDVFAVALQSENAPVGTLSSVTFDVSGDAATGLSIAYFDATGLGTWTR